MEAKKPNTRQSQAEGAHAPEQTLIEQRKAKLAALRENQRQTGPHGRRGCLPVTD